MDFKKTLAKTKQFLASRKQAYQFTFMGNVYSRFVLKDLAKFCRATESTFHPDPRVHAMLEGRKEVWLRISKHLNLSTEQLMTEYGAISKGNTDE